MFGDEDHGRRGKARLLLYGLERLAIRAMTNASQALVWDGGRKLSRQSGADDVDLQAMPLRKNG